MHVRIALCILAILIGASLGLLKVKDPVRFLLRLSCVQVAMFLIYRLCNYFLDFYIDDYSVGLAILRLIPLQLCYFSMLTTIIGLLIRNKTLINLGYLITPVCGIITVLFPDADFNGLSYANPTYFSFLAEHMLLIIIGIAIYSMDCIRRVIPMFRGRAYICADWRPSLILSIFSVPGFSCTRTIFIRIRQAGMSRLNISIPCFRFPCCT